MGIVQEGVRWRSVRTVDDRAATAKSRVNALSPRERLAMERILEELALNGKSKLAQDAAQVEWEEQPLPVRDWLMQEDLIGETGLDMYPQLREDMVELFEGDYHEVILCLHPETRIPLLDGTQPTIRELAERWASDPKAFWVYGIEDGLVVPVRAEAPRQTGVDDYVRVTLDDGSSFISNPRHQMVMRDGAKRMVCDMMVGDSLMPFETGRSAAGYEMVRDPNKPRPVPTHRIAATALSPARAGQVVIHHKNFNRLDNRPDNLEWLSPREHGSALSEALQRANLGGQAQRAGRLSWSSRSAAARARGKEELAQRNRRGKRSRTDITAESIRVTRREGASTLKDTARALNCSPNCVRRALMAAGTTVREEYGEVRGRLPAGARRGYTPPVIVRREPDATARPKLGARCVTLEVIKSAVRAGSLTSGAAAARLGCGRSTIRRVLAAEGLAWRDLLGVSRNNFVVKIETIGCGPVYCMTVPRTTNFAILTAGSEVSSPARRSGVFSSNTGSTGWG